MFIIVRIQRHVFLCSLWVYVKKKTCYPSKTFEPYKIENVYLVHCVTSFWNMKSADNFKGWYSMINVSPDGSSCTLKHKHFEFPPVPSLQSNETYINPQYASQQTPYRFEALEVRPISFSFNVGTLKSCWRKPKGRFPKCLSATPLDSSSVSWRLWVYLKHNEFRGSRQRVSEWSMTVPASF